MTRPGAIARLAAPLRQVYLSRGPRVLERRLHTTIRLHQHSAATADARLNIASTSTEESPTSEPSGTAHPSVIPPKVPTEDTSPLRPLLQSPPIPLSAQTPQLSLAQFLRESRIPSEPSADASADAIEELKFPRTPTFRGTLYELAAQVALRSLGFSVQRTGRPGDLGVDLLGHWHVPGSSMPLRCLVQCKNTAKKLGPSVVRELGGAFEGAPVGWRGRFEAPEHSSDLHAEETISEGNLGSEATDGTIAVLCASQEATKGVRDAIKRAAKPIVWVLVRALEPDDLYKTLESGGEGALEHSVSAGVMQVLWNQHVAQMGLRSVEVGWIYGSEADERKLRLRWKGRIWEPRVAPRENGI